MVEFIKDKGKVVPVL